MTIRAVLSCNGKEGIYDCRQATPVGAVLTAREAREVARKIHHWSSVVIGNQVFDLCSACTKRRQERR